MQGGEHAEADHIKRLLDCAQSCQLAVELLSRGSEMSRELCALCEDFCRICADDCERITDGDQVMQNCADVCSRCADACNVMTA